VSASGHSDHRKGPCSERRRARGVFKRGQLASACSVRKRELEIMRSAISTRMRERVLTPVQVGVGPVGLGDVGNTRNEIGVAMSAVMGDERRRELVRGKPSSPVLGRASNTPRNYVNVEKLLGDVVRLHALRDVILLGLDDLDAASVRACRPIRSMPARGSMVHLLTVIRDAEAMARKIWQEEVAASGVITPRLASLLVKAATADAQTVQRLVKRAGKSIGDAEYDELLDVLNGAVVDP
jgi:hypothetical protein